jgi:hypothetical protein
MVAAAFQRFKPRKNVATSAVAKRRLNSVPLSVQLVARRDNFLPERFLHSSPRRRSGERIEERGILSPTFSSAVFHLRSTLSHLRSSSAGRSKAGSRFACPRTPKSGVLADGFRHAPPFGLRRQSAATTALWIGMRRMGDSRWEMRFIFQLSFPIFDLPFHLPAERSKAAWRFASRRTPNAPPAPPCALIYGCRQ